MSRTLRAFPVDAFTSVPGGGNPAMVVLDAGQLDTVAMQRLASDHHQGDWAFALPASRTDADLDVRFFSPRKELPFVGHATLALHAVLGQFEPRALRRQHGSTGIVEVQRTGSGEFSIRQAPPKLGRIIEAAELREVLPLLGLAPEQLDTRCPVRIAGGASTRLMLGLANTKALDDLAPRMSDLAALSPRLGAQGYFLFVPDTGSGQVITEARMFCPAIGIDEDPVSGNAHAMLGIHLHALGLLPVADGMACFSGRQGRHVGRPGQVRVSLELDVQNRPTAASIAGQAVVKKQAQLTLA
jgi:PhzF family phenazine biosynthesis protein